MSMPREWAHGPQWVAGHQEEWEPVLRAAQAAWSELELVSVSEGLRNSTLLHLEASEVAMASAESAGVGLTLSILESSGSGFRAAVHVSGLSGDWHRAWKANDHDAVGRMLGFPDCCREFFSREWAGTDARDVTPKMGAVDGPWQANTMLRWLGVRLVPHLPCSAQCEKTIESARAYLEMGDRLGIDVGALEKILRLPVTHDAANGVVIVSTPHFRFMAGANREPFVASRPEAAKALTCGVHSTGPRDDRFHYDAPPGDPEVHADGGPFAATVNGFDSLFAMDRAHETVLSVVGDALSALDLGCGDGLLLSKIALGRDGRWHGIEADHGRAEWGNKHRGPRVVVTPGRIQDTYLDVEPYDVVLLMPGRLLEMDPADADRIRAALPRLARRLVLYAYGDWLTKYSGLEGLASAAGLKLIGKVESSPGAAAAEGVVR